MKKGLAVLLSLMFLLSVSGCGDEPSTVPAESTGKTAPASEDTPRADAETETSATGKADAIDVDLTQLSSTMVYSEVYAMASEPGQYLGKTVKMRGLFATQEYNGARLYACIVQDATACCAQGLEFEMADELVYPDDYPEPGTEVTVVGTFDSYKEEADGNYYLYLVLRNARFA